MTDQNNGHKNGRGQVLCPASYYGGLNTDDHLHHVSPAELTSNGGVCAACRKKFSRRFKSQTTHAEMTGPEFKIHAAAGFVGDHAEPFVEPDFALEDGELVATGLDKIAVMAIAKFCLRLFEIGGRNQDKFWEAAHALCFAAHLHPEQHLSGEQIADKYFKTPKTKQAFFKQVNRFRDILNLPRIAGAKRGAARKTYRKSQIKSHAARASARAQKFKNETNDYSNRAFTERFGAAFAAARKAD